MIAAVPAAAGRPVIIEGYAQDFGVPIAKVRFSCDEGETWTSFATPEADPDRNVNWSFSFTPPEAGTYRLLVQAVADDGRTTPEPALVNVEARAEG